MISFGSLFIFLELAPPVSSWQLNAIIGVGELENKYFNVYWWLTIYDMDEEYIYEWTWFIFFVSKD